MASPIYEARLQILQQALREAIDNGLKVKDTFEYIGKILKDAGVGEAIDDNDWYALANALFIQVSNVINGEGEEL